VNAFNDLINKWGLMKIKGPNRVFSWSNNKKEPILAKLDRNFVSVSRDNKYPLANVRMLPKSGIDHNPLRVNFGGDKQLNHSIFRFEKWWLEEPNFEEVVRKAWDLKCPKTDPIQIWQFKIRNLRRKIRAWNVNREAEMRKGKKELISEGGSMDLLSERRPLSESENDRKKEISLKLEQIWRIEEIKARQRSRERDIKEGVKNRAYCFAKANQRRRKNAIACLEDGERILTENKDLINHEVQFYKNCLVRSPCRICS
jgi:hypothetical protein